MALNVSMIYRRTDRGVREVYEKSHKFTQSERLILILLDGRLNVAGLKTRLPSLNDERIERALKKLQDAGLVEPMGAMDGVGMGGPGAPDGRLEPEAVAQFLEQSDLDPVTIFGDSDESVASELVRARVEQAAAQVAREAAAQARADVGPAPDIEGLRRFSSECALTRDEGCAVEHDQGAGLGSGHAFRDHDGQRPGPARPAGRARPSRHRGTGRRAAAAGSARAG